MELSRLHNVYTVFLAGLLACLVGTVLQTVEESSFNTSAAVIADIRTDANSSNLAPFDKTVFADRHPTDQTTKDRPQAKHNRRPIRQTHLDPYGSALLGSLFSVEESIRPAENPVAFAVDDRPANPIFIPTVSLHPSDFTSSDLPTVVLLI